MDKAQSDASETTSRPRRKTNLPTHLDDYDVGYQPAGDLPPTASSHCTSQPRSSSRKPSRSGVSSHSRTSRRSITSVGVYVPPELSSVQTAMLEEKIKQRQYDSLRQQVEEDSLIDLEHQRLQAQAKEAQRMQEEALAAKEALLKQLERQRKLQQAETELEVAKLVSSMLSVDSRATTPVPTDSGSPNAQQLAAQRSQVCSPQLMPSKHQQPTFQSPAVTSSLLPCPTELPDPDVSAASPRPSQWPLPATYTVDAPMPTALHPGPQAFSSPVPDIAPSALTAIPEHSVSLTSNVTPQPSAMFTIPTSAAYPMSTSMQHVTQQPVTATQPTLRYRLQQTATMPGTILPGPSQLPVSNHQASATTPHAPGYVKASVPFGPTVYSPQPSPELLFASAYGIPRPTLPVFESGVESDFALFKLAFDNLLSNHHHISEQYKYHVLLSHLKLSSAHQLAKSFMYHPQPYTAALQALQDKYGQPRQLVQSELGAILSTPPLKLGDANAFDSFALSVQSLVGMLRTLEGQNGYELFCGSHVDRLLSKLPPAYRDSFVEYCLSRGILQTGTDKTYTLPDFADWLQNKSQAKRISSRAAAMFQSETLKTPGRARGAPYSREQPRPVLLTRESVAKTPGSTAPKSSSKPPAILSPL